MRFQSMSKGGQHWANLRGFEKYQLVLQIKLPAAANLFACAIATEKMAELNNFGRRSEKIRKRTQANESITLPAGETWWIDSLGVYHCLIGWPSSITFADDLL